jgi:outer membrane protein assembly factor BamB
LALLILFPLGISLTASGPILARASTGTVWARFNFDASRTGVNPDELTLSAGNVGQLLLLRSEPLPTVADSAPVYQGGHVYFTTKAGSLVAIDLATGAQLWEMPTTGPGFTTSSPALDPSGLWVYSYGLDGSVHKYASTNGEEATGGGWPAPVTLIPGVEKGSSALNVANGWLYMTASAYPGDAGHYDGHLVVVNLASGAEVVFNTLCSKLRVLLSDQPNQPNYCPSRQSGVWARSGAVVEPMTGNIFITSGNGPWDGSTKWGDSVLELSGDGSTLLDSYTPTNQQQLNNSDTDLGSSAPALLPEQPSSTTPFLAVQVGKDGLLRLLNRRNLSGQGKLGVLGGELQKIAAPRSCAVLTAPVVWADPSQATWLFVANDCGLGGYELVTDGSGRSTLVSQWQQSTGGTSPVIANGVLYVARSGAVEARDPLTGNRLWSSTQTSAKIGSIHWQSPIVVDGLLILDDESGTMTVFGLPKSASKPRLYLPLLAR